MTLSVKPFHIARGLLQRLVGRLEDQPEAPADEAGLTRRGLLAGAAAVGATAGLSAVTSSAAAEAASQQTPERTSVTAPLVYDVVVVGAGQAVHTAANAIKTSGRS